MKIYYEITLEELKEFLKKDTWADAKQRIDNMSETELDMLAEYLYNFAEEFDNVLTKTDINNFVLFDWDETREDFLPF